jgi:Flp pilus assembly protein TadB
MELFCALPAIPFTTLVAGLGVGLLLLAVGLLNRPLASSAADPQSPMNLCLKCLNEGHDPTSTLEFIADWGPTATKSEFQGYVQRLKQGRPLDEVLDALRRSRPTVETEFMIACLTSKAQTGLFSAVSGEIVRQTAKQREQTRADMEFLIGGARRWVIGLAWIGILGGAMILIALPVYSDALLQTPTGRYLMVLAVVLEAVGLIVAGRLLSLPNRLEHHLNEP